MVPHTYVRLNLQIAVVPSISKVALGNACGVTAAWATSQAEQNGAKYGCACKRSFLHVYHLLSSPFIYKTEKEVDFGH